MSLEILTPKHNVSLDATILSSLMSCGTLTDYRFNHDLQLITGKSNGMECGSIVHHFLEAYYRELINGKTKFEAQKKGFEHASLYIKGCHYCIKGENCPDKHPLGEFMGVKNTPEESQTEPKKVTGWAFVFESIEKYLDYTKNDSWVPIEVEHVKGKVIYEDDDIRILWKAKYDLIVDTIDGLIPVDHKTMSFGYDILDLNNQFMGQCLLLAAKYVTINKIGFQKSYAPKDRFIRENKYYTIDQLTEFATETVPFWAKTLIMYAESGYWPHNYMSCEKKFGRCDFYEICKEDRDVRSIALKMKFYKGRKWDISNDQ